jgi:hypothetical protein
MFSRRRVVASRFPSPYAPSQPGQSGRSDQDQKHEIGQTRSDREQLFEAVNRTEMIEARKVDHGKNHENHKNGYSGAPLQRNSSGAPRDDPTKSVHIGIQQKEQLANQ